MHGDDLSRAEKIISCSMLRRSGGRMGWVRRPVTNVRPRTAIRRLVPIHACNGWPPIFSNDSSIAL